MTDKLQPRGTTRRRRWRWILLGILAIGLVVAVAVGAIAAYFSARIPESGSRQTVLFYSRPTDLLPGARMNADDLQGRLKRLSYRQTSESPQVGEYRARSGTFEIYLRGFRDPDYQAQPGRVRVTIKRGRVAELEVLDELSPADCRLEPERIAGYEGSVGAFLNPIHLGSVPPLLADALIAIEDRRFFKHLGIDPIGSVRALWTDLRSGEKMQGGSTITQQLARSLFLHNRKTVSRKIEEAFLAVGLELRYSKSEILEAYLNAVYWGTWGGMEIRGAREAAQYYLGCDLEEADPAGIALLVALIRAPNAYSPYASPERARHRRDLVLNLLNERGLLGDEEVRTALATPLPKERPPDRIAAAGYYIDAARREIEDRAPSGTLDRTDITVFTTLDPRDQTATVLSLREGLENLERKYRRLRRNKAPLQGAVVVVDPHLGEVRALVGGRDHLTSPWNRAIDAQRQPGSAFKPFVYLAAFQHPHRKDGTDWTPASIVIDEPVVIPSKPEAYRPRNYDKEYLGKMTVRTALELSRNVPTASVGHEVGIAKVANAARDLGIRSSLNEYPSLALGASEVNLLELTVAFGGFATGGNARTPTFLRGILGPDGETIPLRELRDPPGIAPQEAYLVSHILEGVMDRGTGRVARQLGVDGSIAGKTGTTNDYRDAWFIGYTPERVAGVWVGFDQNDVTGLSGAAAALPIWASIIKRIRPASGDGDFARPRGIITVAVCTESGLLATGDCPSFLMEDFMAGTEPTRDCDAHGAGFFNRLRKFFRL